MLLSTSPPRHDLDADSDFASESHQGLDAAQPTIVFCPWPDFFLGTQGPTLPMSIA